MRFAITTCILLFIGAFLEMNVDATGTTQLLRIDSRYVKDQDFIIQVYLPSSYGDTTKSFPVIYLLDADRSFGMSMDIVEWLGYGKDIGEVIVVGIGYGGSTERWWNLRARDFTPTRDREKKYGDWPETGGARNFQMFLEKELFPTIEVRYTTKPDQRTLFGFDLGGLFASYIMLTKPELFQNYVLISPTISWDNRYIFGLEKKYFNRNKELNANVFVMMGGLDSKEDYLIPGSEFVETLRNRDYKGFKLFTHRYDNDTHFSVFPAALTDGIKAIYKRE
jgi:uncharacterized protein